MTRQEKENENLSKTLTGITGLDAVTEGD